MRPSFKIVDDVLVVTAAGEIDHHTAGYLKDSIDDAMEGFCCRYLVMDMEKVTFMDSSGIGVILGRYNKLSKKNGRVIVSGCSEYIEKILHMAGVFTLVEKRDCADEALWELRGQEKMRLEVSGND